MKLKELSDNYELYLGYAYKICLNEDLKYDIVNDAYIKLDAYFKKYPEKTISKRFIWQTLKSVYIDDIRSRRLVCINIDDIELNNNNDKEGERLTARIKLNEALGELKFVDREILLKTEEKSLRIVAKQLQCNHVTIFNRRKNALTKLKEQWQKRHQ